MTVLSGMDAKAKVKTEPSRGFVWEPLLKEQIPVTPAGMRENSCRSFKGLLVQVLHLQDEELAPERGSDLTKVTAISRQHQA